MVIVDEAQSLGVALLEELRLLSNINQDKTLQPHVLVRLSRLEEKRLSRDLRRRPTPVSFMGKA